MKRTIHTSLAVLTAVTLAAVTLAAVTLAAACTPEEARASAPKGSDSTTNERADAPAKKAPMQASADDIKAPADVAAAPADAQKTASGLVYKPVTKGAGGDKPAPTDTVEVHYTGWTTDGKMFDSSVERGRTASFPLNGVIKGWTEGLQLMSVGDTYRFWIPGNLAYGDTPTRPGAPAGMLVFDVELKNILRMPTTPTDVKAAPADATKTASGLAYKVLKKGAGTKHPVPTDQVEVHYAGWTTDGNLFDTSYKRGQTAKFGLGQVIKGWTEGVQLMNEGDKFRFWIPGNLAYGDTPSRPGAPAGTLVFDVELVKIGG